MSTISEKNLRTLAAKISNLDAFICGDTGPMHLASASGTATIALFKATSPTLYGTLGKKDLSLVMQGKSIEEIAHEIMTHLKAI
jgi:ADP-heptose:LPS heptosyltransferase